METVSQAHLDALLKDGEVLLRAGDKSRIVLRPDQSIVKMFRSKRRLRHAKRFIKCAKTYHRKGITTVEPSSLYCCPEDDCVFVTYPYLDGMTVKQLIAQGDDTVLAQVVDFMIALHDIGIYYRDFHPGNLIVRDDHIAVIDMHNTHFFPFALGIRRRAKNIAAFFFRNQTAGLFSEEQINNFVHDYLDRANLRPAQQVRFWKHFARYREERQLWLARK
ncbi:MAG: hypothetical protein CMF50_05315 [Legionellales bacterium]|nr:hypothetical protein [Legionellales bacterium]